MSSSIQTGDLLSVMDNILAITYTTDSDATHPTASPNVCNTELEEKARHHAVQALTYEHIHVQSKALSLTNTVDHRRLILLEPASEDPLGPCPQKTTVPTC